MLVTAGMVLLDDNPQLARTARIVYAQRGRGKSDQTREVLMNMDSVGSFTLVHCIA
jgi:hypothetical protein